MARRFPTRRADQWEAQSFLEKPRPEPDYAALSISIVLIEVVALILN